MSFYPTLVYALLFQILLLFIPTINPLIVGKSPQIWLHADLLNVSNNTELRLATHAKFEKETSYSSLEIREYLHSRLTYQ